MPNLEPGQIGYILGRSPVLILGYKQKGYLIQYLRKTKMHPPNEIGDIVVRSQIYPTCKRKYKIKTSEKKIANDLWLQYLFPIYSSKNDDLT